MNTPPSALLKGQQHSVHSLCSKSLLFPFALALSLSRAYSTRSYRNKASRLLHEAIEIRRATSVQEGSGTGSNKPRCLYACTPAPRTHRRTRRSHTRHALTYLQPEVSRNFWLCKSSVLVDEKRRDACTTHKRHCRDTYSTPPAIASFFKGHEEARSSGIIYP